MEEMNKERVRKFLVEGGGVIDITTIVRFVELNPETGCYEKKISDEIFTKTHVTTEMFNCMIDRAEIVDMEFRNMGKKIFDVISSVLK